MDSDIRQNDTFTYVILYLNKALALSWGTNDIVVCHSDGCQNPSWFSLKRMDKEIF